MAVALSKNVASVVVETLAAARVNRIYGVAEDSLNAITDSIRAQGDTRWVPVRHEEVAAYAAGAEDAPDAFNRFDRRVDGHVKVILDPAPSS